MLNLYGNVGDAKILVSNLLQPAAPGSQLAAEPAHIQVRRRAFQQNPKDLADQTPGTGQDQRQLKEVNIRGARGGNDLQDLVPSEELILAPEMPASEAYNVGQPYSKFAASIRGASDGEDAAPDFDHAVGLHRFIDAIRQSSNEGRRVTVG